MCGCETERHGTNFQTPLALCACVVVVVIVVAVDVVVVVVVVFFLCLLSFRLLIVQAINNSELNGT